MLSFWICVGLNILIGMTLKIIVVTVCSNCVSTYNSYRHILLDSFDWLLDGIYLLVLYTEIQLGSINLNCSRPSPIVINFAYRFTSLMKKIVIRSSGKIMRIEFCILFPSWWRFIIHLEFYIVLTIFNMAVTNCKTPRIHYRGSEAKTVETLNKSGLRT